jgi:hypothetical protein
VPNKRVYTFISSKVCLLTLIEPKRQTLPEINVYARLFSTLEYSPVPWQVVKIKDTHFCVKNLKMKRKNDKFFDLPERGFEPQIFSNSPAHDLNFHEK